jgi:superfamily II DNA helicase RecQ
MLLSRRFTKVVLQNPEFHKRVLSVVIDEAHVVSHWGSEFRKKYGTLGKIRAFLPRNTPIVALSATLSARLRSDVLAKLQFGNDYINIDEGNDRANVSIVVRGIEHALNTYADLDFVVAMLHDDPSEIPKTFIYADNIAVGQKIIEHLLSLLPLSLQLSGIIRPYNAAYGSAYRKAVMSEFAKGTIRILVCTDAAGMVS